MQIYEEITPAEHETEQNLTITVPKRRRGSWVMLQAVLCLLVLLSVLLLKFLLPDFYHTLRERYDAEMQRSILISHAESSNP